MKAETKEKILWSLLVLLIIVVVIMCSCSRTADKSNTSTSDTTQVSNVNIPVVDTIFVRTKDGMPVKFRIYVNYDIFDDEHGVRIGTYHGYITQALYISLGNIMCDYSYNQDTIIKNVPKIENQLVKDIPTRTSLRVLVNKVKIKSIFFQHVTVNFDNDN